MTAANPNQFGAPAGENAYMDQEEEWEREGLLDPAWEKQQRKVRHVKPLETMIVKAKAATYLIT